MTLSDFLEKTATSDQVFADAIGVSRQSLHRYKNRERRPEWDVLERIVVATDGRVTANDFLSVPLPEGSVHAATLPTEPSPVTETCDGAVS